MLSDANMRRSIHDEEDLRNLLVEAFFGDAPDLSPDGRFVYYTDADTAMKIIKEEEVWFRNALVMNDYTEIGYGLDGIRGALFAEGDASGVFAAAGEMVGSIRERLESELRGTDLFWRKATYLACLSRHEDSEDTTGRLSMWRAYGDVAIVINGASFAAPPSGPSVVQSGRVHYLDRSGFARRLSDVARTLRVRATDLKTNRKIGPESMVSAFIALAYNAAIRTKHPGFAEEQEFRVVFHPPPPEPQHPHITPKQVVIKGVAQTVWVLKLVHDPANGLTGADLPSLLERIIIGPTAQPLVSREVFVRLLEAAGVPGAGERVVMSDIPLRT